MKKSRALLTQGLDWNPYAFTKDEEAYLRELLIETIVYGEDEEIRAKIMFKLGIE